MFWASQSITLSERTFNAWKHVGAKFFRPSRSDEYITRIVRQSDRDEEFFLNLGRVTLAALSEGLGGLPVWNNGPDTIWSLNTPVRTRELFHDLMAPQTGETEYVWVKEPGWGGRGKERLLTASVDLDSLPYWEDHVDGDEYRILTVGDLRVQQFRKESESDAGGHPFSFTWLPMRDLPVVAKRLVKQASNRLPRRSFVGWDVIVQQVPPGLPGAASELQENAQRAYLIEGNSCPGVNEATAERVVNAIRTKEAEYART